VHVLRGLIFYSKFEEQKILVMADFIKGEVAILYIYDGAVYRPIACLTSNSLNSTLGVIETQTKCEPGQTIKGAGSFAYTIDAEGNYIDTTSAGGETDKASHDYLLTKQQTKEIITWRLDTGLADTPNYYGEGLISDLTADFPAGDEFATFSATIDGSGDIVTSDPETP
jgi:hypothetical protein